MRHLLWHSRDVFDARQEKSAAALVALAQELEAGGDLGGGEADFLDLFGRCCEVDADAFTRVWTDPSAYLWVRTGFDLLAACRGTAAPSERARSACSGTGEQEPATALRVHLEGFKRFALAAHWLAGEDCELAAPLRAPLPLALPGTELSIAGDGELELTSLRGGRLLGRRRGRALELDLAAPGADGGPGPAVVACPVVRTEGCRLRLQPHAFHALPGLDHLAPVVEAGLPFHRAGEARVRRAVGIVARYEPHAFEQLRDRISLVGLKPQGKGSFTNTSHSDLPGAMVVSETRHPFDLAETLVHELHHNRLFCIEERGAFFAGDGRVVDEPRHPSPWRDDPRPLHGILHGFYAYVAVTRFWWNVAQAGDVPPDVGTYARSRLARESLHLLLARHQLEAHGAFSDLGRACFREIGDAAAALRSEIRAGGILPGTPAWRCTPEGSLEPERDEAGRVRDVAGSVRRRLERLAPDSRRCALLEALEAETRLVGP
jgi:HEXXH motif-containing protein